MPARPRHPNYELRNVVHDSDIRTSVPENGVRILGTRPRAAFTLIEVLVALAVLGAIASSAIALIGQNTRYVASAEDRMLASIIADNAMVEALSIGVIELGETQTPLDFAGGRWSATRIVANSGVAGLVRVEIAVTRAGGAQTLARVMTLRPGGSQ